LLFVFALVILLFPDGRLTRRWTWLLWVYLTVGVVAVAGVAIGEAGSLAAWWTGGSTGPGTTPTRPWRPSPRG
jgi:hypothetical protein